ncbi:plasmid pRiA4b ORF-3 family protein [Paracrocinitomix mangrovi]|uniref:plasmid pRiA4b ORF-3 family protein n=1 Tax=Paracrocinitomix mangrovi TaxID=2862509 RepID=UPI001C8DE44C|nr:plasmid pRiA4b ORF-3 family protein [Paracrocinitomix mangrovi]UKN01496.1 plasmid pRiA4b ORF-3 family protein [Paracrocinitomix mangrovi]
MPSYKFRILLDTDGNEEIFRDIVISSSENFEIFYRAIITSFGFSGQELASFYVSNEEWDKGHEIALMDMEINNNLDAPSIMKETILSDLVNNEDQKFVLVYDFLRMWCFMIELVDTLPTDYDDPQLVLSVGDAPDEMSKEIDFNADFGMDADLELGNDLDDIFSDFDDEDEDFEGFENIDDMDF